MENYSIEYKVSSWRRIGFENKEDYDKAIALINSGECPENIEDYTDNYSIDNTDEYLSPEDNDNQSTIEGYCNGELIWSNVE